jgi:benzoyl-CoA reductase/2-hydroxyglutaryl-CoA dehydratase subunit BcrC/BadD/HgdB
MANAMADGLALAEKYYTEYGSRARELKASGKKVIGYLTALGPVEVLTAAGVVPLRLKGDVTEPITRADAHMETIVCPFIRNVFDSALKGKFGYVDGMVMPHQCDSTEKTNNEWAYNLNLPYWHFLNVPHVTDGPSLEFFKSVLGVLIKSLERFTGRAITEQDLAAAVKAHNANRRAMRALYDLRKADPPLISGVEMTQVLVAAMSLPVEESTALIEGVTAEVQQRAKAGKAAGGAGARVMLIGDQIDNTSVAKIVEDAGGKLVMDYLSIGSKVYFTDAAENGDPVGAIAERYLRKIKIPTTHIVSEGQTYEQNLEARFGHLKGYIKDFGVNAVILFVYKYCDPYGFEVPAVKRFIEQTGASVLYLEDEYSTSTLGRTRTRIEAFLEMIA